MAMPGADEFPSSECCVVDVVSGRVRGRVEKCQEEKFSMCVGEWLGGGRVAGDPQRFPTYFVSVVLRYFNVLKLVSPTLDSVMAPV